jgi:hypothetical protein
MAHTVHVIPIHPLAPAKAVAGAACNGCGVCCLVEPCPLGIVLSHRRTGACGALRWDGSAAQYRCGAIVAPQEVLRQSLPRAARWLSPGLAPLLVRLAVRWIAAGTGCDSHLEVLRDDQKAEDPGLADKGSTTMAVTALPTEMRALARPAHHD